MGLHDRFLHPLSGQDDSNSRPNWRDVIEDIAAADLNAFETWIRANEPALGDAVNGGGAWDAMAVPSTITARRLSVAPISALYSSSATAPPFIAAQESPTPTAPHATLPRIDILVADNSTGAVAWVDGTANASPTLPAVPTGKTALWAVYWRPSTTTVDPFGYNTGTNSYIYRDLRPKFGRNTLDGALVLTGITGVISVTADQDNYSPTGFATSSTVLLSPTAARNITGFAAPAAVGDIKLVFNIGGFNIVLKDASTSSTAANRFAFPSGDVTLLPNMGIWLAYETDGTNLRWRSAGGSGGGGGTPALVFGTANTPGAATTFLRTNDAIAVFDATAPVTQAFSDAAAVGSAAFAARRDHKHGMPAGGGATNFPFTDANLAASLTSSAMAIPSDANLKEFVMPWAGSIIGVSVACENARTAGTATFKPTINGTESATLSVILDGTNTQYFYGSQASGVDTFTAGQRIGVKVTTSGTWAAGTTPSVIVTVFAIPALSPGGGTIIAQEVDASPSGAIGTLVLPNGTLGIVGTVGTYTPASAGAMTLIETKTLGSDVASTTFSSIPGTYKHLFLLWQAASDQAASAAIYLRFNADSGSNYDNDIGQSSGGTASYGENLAAAQGRIGTITGTNNANSAASGRLEVPNYAGTTWQKQWTSQSAARNAASNADFTASFAGGLWRNTAAITSLTILVTTGNLKTGSVLSLYGLSG